MADNTPPEGDSQAPASPQQRRRRTLRWWGHLANYVLLGVSAVIILVDITESGGWRRLGMPLLFISIAIVNLASMHAVERRRAERSAAPDRRGM